MYWMNATSSASVQTALAEDSRTGSSPVTWGGLLRVCIIVVVKRTTLRHSDTRVCYRMVTDVTRCGIVLLHPDVHDDR